VREGEGVLCGSRPVFCLALPRWICDSHTSLERWRCAVVGECVHVKAHEWVYCAGCEKVQCVTSEVQPQIIQNGQSSFTVTLTKQGWPNSAWNAWNMKPVGEDASCGEVSLKISLGEGSLKKQQDVEMWLIKFHAPHAVSFRGCYGRSSFDGCKLHNPRWSFIWHKSYSSTSGEVSFLSHHVYAWAKLSVARIHVVQEVSYGSGIKLYSQVSKAKLQCDRVSCVPQRRKLHFMLHAYWRKLHSCFMWKIGQGAPYVI